MTWKSTKTCHAFSAVALHGHIYPILRFKHHLVGDPTLWLFNIAMENGPFIDDFPIKTSIYKGFSMAMLVITRWYPIKLYPVIDSNTFKYPHVSILQEFPGCVYQVTISPGFVDDVKIGWCLPLVILHGYWRSPFETSRPSMNGRCP